MNEDDNQVLVTDMHSALAGICGELIVSNDYWEKIPALFCILGHPNETIARNGAKTIRLQFDADPRPPPVHDELTWRWMQQFGDSIDLFIAGSSRWSLSKEFVIFFCILALIPITDRC